MPRIKPLISEARMDESLLATIDKYKRLASITRYVDLGPKIGRCGATACNRYGHLVLLHWKSCGGSCAPCTSHQKIYYWRSMKTSKKGG